MFNLLNSGIVNEEIIFKTMGLNGIIKGVNVGRELV